MRARCFLSETMSDFKRLLLLILNTEVRINNMKKSLEERKNFDITKAFIACGGSADGNKRIKTEQLSKFMI